MKTLKVVFAFVLLIGCKSIPESQESFVGVWELVEVRMKNMDVAPSDLVIFNKKDIYTKEGNYYSFDPEAIEIVDERFRTYKYENKILTVFGDDGEKLMEARASFTYKGLLCLETKDGDLVFFEKISNDPKVNPKLERYFIGVRAK